MQFSCGLAVLFAAAGALVSAQTTHNVVVGASGLIFSPSQVTAAVGDIVQFEFHPKNHTLTQSTFKTPCTAMTGGVNSGFMPVAANATTFPVFSFKVNQVTPLWFFCAQTGHCPQGMVFAINVNASSPNTFDAFLANATGNSTSTSASGSTSGTGGSSYGSGAPAASGMVTSTAAGAAATGASAAGTASTSKSSGFARHGMIGKAGASFGLVALVFVLSL